MTTHTTLAHFNRYNLMSENIIHYHYNHINGISNITGIASKIGREDWLFHDTQWMLPHYAQQHSCIYDTELWPVEHEPARNKSRIADLLTFLQQFSSNGYDVIHSSCSMNHMTLQSRTSMTVTDGSEHIWEQDMLSSLLLYYLYRGDDIFFFYLLCK